MRMIEMRGCRQKMRIATMLVGRWATSKGAACFAFAVGVAACDVLLT